MSTAETLAADKRVARGCAAVLSAVFDIAPENFFRATRGPAHEATLRQILLTVMRRVLDLDVKEPASQRRLGEALGWEGDPRGRHRTTVAHAINEIEDRCEKDARYEAKLAELTEKCRGVIYLQTLVFDELLGAA